MLTERITSWLARIRAPAALLPVVALLAACAALPASSASTATEVASSPSATVSTTPVSSMERAAIVGTWHRAQSCEAMLAAFSRAGLATSHADWLQGNFFGEAAPPADRPCDGALGPLEHDHFFALDGAFGSHDQVGQSVDDGDYVPVGDDMLSFPSHAREFGYAGELVVKYAISGETTTFDVSLPESCEDACKDAYAWATSAFASGPWEKGSVPRCPNPDGGASNRCLGELRAGRYPTSKFAPALRYAVPEGWGNFEDMPGNFLLIPPGGSLAGIADGSSDYVAAYAGVAIADPTCEEASAPGVRQNALAMTEALASRPGLVASDPTEVTVGGLNGLMVDVDLAPGWTGSCPFAPGLPTVPLIIGAGPASLHHVQIAGASTRFYFLDGVPPNVVIEVNDAPGDTGRTDYESIISQFEFAAPG